MKPYFFLLLALTAIGALRGAEAPDADASARIAALRAEIARHDALYHRENAPEISDAAYDRLRQELAVWETRHPEAARASTPVPAFGDDRTGRLPGGRHGAPMLSLVKVHTPEELQAFHARMAQVLGREEVEYVVEPKLDGLAVNLVFEAGRLIQALTRGDGSEGEDITGQVAAMTGVPVSLRSGIGLAPWPARMEVRGEIYVPWREFERVNAEREAEGEPRFASPRALAAGTVRQRDPQQTQHRGLRVACFALGRCEPAAIVPGSHRDLQAAFVQWGLPGVPAQIPARGGAALERAVTQVRASRSEAAYPSDGAVVKLNAFAEQRLVGESEAAPRWAAACKFEPERAETRVRGIVLQVGRTGVLTPVAELVPVRLAGSVIARATLHNFDEIERKDVRVGDLVYLEMAGDVIPAIVGVDPDRRPPAAEPYVVPLACPDCFAPVVQAMDRVARRCSGQACPGQLRRRIEHYASKRAVDIEGLGPAMVAALVGHGWVRDLPDLYRLKRADLLRLGRDNERSVDALLGAIERSRTAELWRLIHGLSLPQIGAATAKEIARRYGSLAEMVEKGSVEEPALQDARARSLLADLLAAGVSGSPPPPSSRILAGKVFVLTGSLPTLSRAEAAALIEAAGGRVSNSVSRSTHYLVVGADPGTKLDRARALGVPLLDETGLQRLLAGRESNADR